MDVREVLEDLASRLRTAFPSRVRDVVLFGSQLTGKGHEGSDYDFVILWEGSLDWRMERAISDVCYETDLKYGIVTDTRVLTNADMHSLRGKQPVYEDALKFGLHAAA